MRELAVIWFDEITVFIAIKKANLLKNGSKLKIPIWFYALIDLEPYGSHSCHVDRLCMPWLC